MTDEEIERLKQQMIKRRQTAPIEGKDLLSTGSTLVNLAMSGRTRGGIAKGHYYLFVGNTNSGKTWLGMSAFGEANLNSSFDDYDFIFDQPERGALMDWDAYFGKGVSERIRPPRGTLDDPLHSETVEEFYHNLNNALDEDRPCIYILDSMDALDAEQDLKKSEKDRRRFNKGTSTSTDDDDEEDEGKSKGTYGTAKAKKNSTEMRKVVGRLDKTKSILVVINQTRDNLGFGFTKKTRSGGWGLEFYACVQLWTSVKGKISKDVKAFGTSKERNIGNLIEVHIKRTRIAGKEHKIEVPIIHGLGIDDVGSCVDYLITEGRWKRTKGIIEASEFSFSGYREKLLRKIEEDEKENELVALVGKTWNEIEQASAPDRKSRY